MKNTLTFLLVSVLLVPIAVGCGPKSQDFKIGGTRYDDIARMSVIASSPLVDYDDDRIPDGVSIHVYLRRANEDTPVAGNGAMLFHLIRRTKNPQGRPSDEELYVWRLAAEDVTQAVERDRFGLLVYRMELYWRKLTVRGPGIHLLGEFTRPDGHVVRSSILPLPITSSPGSDRRS